MKRRQFIINSILAAGSVSIQGFNPTNTDEIITVNGSINAKDAGFTLAHEHILVEFIGAKSYDPLRWDRDEVYQSVLPHIIEIKKLGCSTFLDCTPAYLGRDVRLLKMISDATSINIVTNTGYYGAVDNKYLPAKAFNMSAQEMASIWIKEFKDGIDGTDIRPGFIKIGVNSGKLSELHAKLAQAAAITHKKTGLTIASHTGPSDTAFEQIAILKQLGVSASAFVWVHAQNEKDVEAYVKAAKLGAWISLDGVQESNIEVYIDKLEMIKKSGFLDKVLVSHDAGWYEPGKNWAGPARAYTAVFKQLIPTMRNAGFSPDDIAQIFEINPRQAFAVGIKSN